MPLKSSKWSDMNTDLALAARVEPPLLLSLGVETLTLAFDDVLSPKTKLESVLRQQPGLAAAARKGAMTTRKSLPRKD